MSIQWKGDIKDGIKHVRRSIKKALIEKECTNVSSQSFHTHIHNTWGK